MKTYKTIWITGASSGLGKALAIAYASQGVWLFLSGRNTENLKQVAAECRAKQAKVSLYVFDLTIFQEVGSNTRAIIEEAGHIDILILNAGIGQRSLVVNASLESEKHIMLLNYWSAVWLTKAILPTLAQQPSAQIAVISSVSGLFGFPLRSTYAASKHALMGYFESLSIELKNSPVTISKICPGRINTGFSERALTGNLTAQGTSDKAHQKVIATQNAANKIIKAILRKRHFYAFGGKEMLLWYAKRINYTLFYYLASKLPHNS